MKRMCKRVTAFVLVLVMLFTTGCSSGFYADELNTVSGNSSVSGNDYLETDSIVEDNEDFDNMAPEEADHILNEVEDLLSNSG